jgi:exonuclease III
MSKNRNRTSCALDPERDGFARLLETFRDVWRDAHPKARGFTYFKDTRANRETTGWRIDHALAGAPPGGAALQVAVDIRTAWPAGDHVPLVARVKAPPPV